MKKFIFSLFCMLSISTLAFANKPLFSSFAFFGDSLTDMGNNPVPPGTPRTNPGGATWAQYLAEKFNNNAIPSNNGGDNYAFAGDGTNKYEDPKLPYPGYTDNGVLGQISTYLRTHQKLDSHGLYSVWAGANNILFAYTATPVPAVITQAVSDIGVMVQQLHAAGAKYILVMNLPDVGKTPAGSRNPPLYTNASLSFNHQLLNTLNASGFDIIQVDTFSLLNSVIANPSHFGFSNVTSPCNLTEVGINSICSNPNQYLFWDPVHPTAAAHRLLADAVYAQITGPLDIATLADQPFGVMDGQNYSLENQLYNVRTRVINLPLDYNSVFASGNYISTNKKTSDDDVIAYNAHSTDIIVGVMRRIADDFIVGAAASHAPGHGNFARNQGDYDSVENIFSLFSGYQHNKYYVDGFVNYGAIDYNPITRNILLGTSENPAEGKTQGSQWGGYLFGGYNVVDNLLQTGPIANLDYQTVHINSYSETAMVNGTGESFDSQNNNSFSTGLGWQASYDWVVNSQFEFTPFAQLAYEHQWYSGSRNIGAGLITLPGSHFTIPVTGGDQNYGLASIGAAEEIMKNISISLAYQSTIFNDFATQNVMGSIQASF